MVTQNMNQFEQSPIKGNIAAIVNPNTISVVIDPASALNSVAPLYAGDMVALSNAVGSAIMVDKAIANSTMFGVVIYTPKKDKFVAGDALEVAMAGSVVYMEAENAVARGESLQYVPGTSVVKPWVNAVETAIGIALDKSAASAGNLIRVLVA